MKHYSQVSEEEDTKRNGKDAKRLTARWRLSLCEAARVTNTKKSRERSNEPLARCKYSRTSPDMHNFFSTGVSEMPAFRTRASRGEIKLWIVVPKGFCQALYFEGLELGTDRIGSAYGGPNIYCF